MEVAYNAGFESQKERFSFCFTCEQCANFDDETEACLHGFPSTMHRLSYYEAPQKPRTILFCKEFDLA